MSEAKEGPYKVVYDEESEIAQKYRLTGPGYAMDFLSCTTADIYCENLNLAFAQGRLDLAKKFEKWLRDIDSPNWPSRKEMLAKLDELVGK